jgi:ABC-type antimicrobial peptide transport system permease subunit
VFFVYLRRELHRRLRQAVLIAIGLAVGIGLVITVTALSTGVKDAQGTVLHSLYGVGTDITVSKPPSANANNPRRFQFQQGSGTAQRPAPGTKINIDNLTSFGSGALNATSVSTIAKLNHVAAAAGGLSLTDTKISGKLPAFNAQGGGGFGNDSGSSGSNRPRLSLTPTSFSVDGVDLSQGALGPLSSGTVTAGRTFTSADANANVAVLDSGYAKQNKLKTGSTVTIAKQKFTVIGLVRLPASSGATDTYIPLARAQALADMKGKVNVIYVAADSASSIGAVSKAIPAAVKGVTVTNSSDLAGQVTGSLASTASLASNLGRWVAAAALIAAILLASLLTMAAVSRRVREFGTLKALGWRNGRVVRQVAGESLVIGLIGGAAGIGLGYLGARLISSLAPPLSASTGATTGNATPGGPQAFNAGPGGFGGPPGGGGGFRRLGAASTHTVAVHLTAPVTIGVIAAAVVLAIAAGLIAGAFGGWRAARLRPAAALARTA